MMLLEEDANLNEDSLLIDSPDRLNVSVRQKKLNLEKIIYNKYTHLEATTSENLPMELNSENRTID